MVRENSKAIFDRAADVFELDQDQRDRMWRQARELNLSPDDPTSVFLALSGVLDRASASFSDLPAQVEAAARRVVNPVARAASEKVRADFVDLSASIARDVSAEASATIEARVSHEIALRRFGVSGVLAAAALVLALLFGVAGFYVGKGSTSSIAAEWQGVATRSDAREWFAIAAANPDLASSIRSYCGPGSNRARVIQGARMCELPIWLEGASAPATGAVAGVRSSVLDWLYGWGPLWLLTGGLLAGLLIRRAVLSFSTLPGVRWLLAA